MAQVDIKNATIKFKDGTTPTPKELEIKIGEGNVNWTETVNRDYKLDKGKLDTVRNGDEAPVTVSLDFQWEWLKASTGNPPTPVDVLKKRGEAAAWVSSSADACEPYAIDVEITIDPNCSDGSEYEVITFPDFRHESLDYDLREGTISCSGGCNVVEATVARVAVT